MPTGLKIGLGILAGCGCLGLGTVLLGTIAAIALPFFLTKRHVIRAPEAKTYIGSLNRANQAYFLENGQFTDNLEALQIGIPAETENYRYDLQLLANELPSVIATATPKQNTQSAMTGAVFALPMDNEDDLISTTVICQSLELGSAPPDAPKAPETLDQPIQCPPGSEAI